MARQKTILIVDDNEDNIEMLMALLGDRYDLLASLDGERALTLLEEESVDLILLDILMPGMDGFDVYRRIRSNEHTQEIPVIFITVKNDEDTIEKAYKMGGADYITKPFRAREVLSRVEKELSMQEMIRKLTVLASTDPLTKLYNRRYFSEIAQRFMALAKRDEGSLSVIMLDIDRFKQVNDIYGHQAGDAVLVNLANIIMEFLRNSDVACRFGGEEFVILLPKTSLDDAREIAQKLRKKVEESLVFLPSNGELSYTISLGVASADTQKDSDIDAPLKRADEALYAAKAAGRNKVC